MNGRPVTRHIAGLLVLALIVLNGCGLTASDDRKSDAPRELAHARSVLYEYCVLALRAGPDPDRPRVVKALRTLGELYRSEPNTPFPGQDRDQVRQVIQLAAHELDVCDQRLAHSARALLTR